MAGRSPTTGGGLRMNRNVNPETGERYKRTIGELRGMQRMGQELNPMQQQRLEAAGADPFQRLSPGVYRDPQGNLRGAQGQMLQAPAPQPQMPQNVGIGMGGLNYNFPQKQSTPMSPETLANIQDTGLRFGPNDPRAKQGVGALLQPGEMVNASMRFAPNDPRPRYGNGALMQPDNLQQTFPNNMPMPQQAIPRPTPQTMPMQQAPFVTNLPGLNQKQSENYYRSALAAEELGKRGPVRNPRFEPYLQNYFAQMMPATNA